MWDGAEIFDWSVESAGVADAILAHIRALGYIVKEFRVNGTVEYHAVPVPNGEPQIARCNDGDDDDSAYRAACLLAVAVGIDLEDG